MHHRREKIYSIADDKTLTVSSLSQIEQKKDLISIKSSNMKPKTMVLHQDLNRLFVSMKEGMIFLFDISNTVDPTPIVLHTVIFPYFVSRIQIDTSINQL